MSDIHSSAVVAAGARIGKNVRIGAYSVIGPEVVLKDGVNVHSHVSVSGRTEVGERTEIMPFAAVGGSPQDTSYRNEPTSLVIGSDCVIHEYATIHRGTSRGRGVTTVGSHVYMMIASHVAHDCVVGNHVVLVNQATLGGHVTVGEHAILGGLSAVQQRCRIGAHAFIGGLSAVVTDVIPFASAIGNRAKLGGLNIVGLKRRGFDRKTIHALRAAYEAIFWGDGTIARRVDRVAEEYAKVPAVMTIVQFIRDGADHPLCTPRRRGRLAEADDA
ncbi:MAG TPA: acyl-ACP--UDP-N-acetylglucosamine O-acyltransferase [Bauldia sp.]|nr:acyl-ACP--UDP-N-acetylglucosamine O-acyltransferase [Bauldia sp.]